MQEKGKIRYYIPRGSFGSSAGVVLLILSVFFRLVGYWGGWQSMTQIDQICYLALPISAALLMVLCLLLLSRVALWATSLPVLLGMAYFVSRVIVLDNKLFLVLWVLLCTVIAVLWIGTVFNVMHLRWLLPPLFLLPFLYQMWAVDLPALQRVDPPVSFSDGMKEMSMLGILLAMFCISLAIRKRYKTKPESAQSETPARPEVAEEVAAEVVAAAVIPAGEAVSAQTEAEDVALPEPKPEPEPASEKGGMFGKLFHRGEKKDPEVEPRIERPEPEEAPLLEEREEESLSTEKPEPASEAEAMPESEYADTEQPETEKADEAEDTDR